MKRNKNSQVMKFRLMLTFIMTALSLSLSSCSTDGPDFPTVPEQPVTPETPSKPETGDNEGNNDDNENNEKPMNNKLKITIGSTSFAATLEDNAAVTALKALMPLTIRMSELNGNEKYFYLDGNLPTASSRPGTIRTGDLMLYGSNCLVIFYKSFSSSYSYTRLGRIDNPSGLEAALGSGSATITFELQ